MDLEIYCKSVETSADNYKTVKVSISGVEKSDVLQHFNLEDIF